MNGRYKFLKLCSIRSLITITISLLVVRFYLEIVGTLNGTLHGTKRSQEGKLKHVVYGNSDKPFTVHGSQLRNKSKYYMCDTSHLMKFSHQLNKISTDWNVWTHDKTIDCPRLNITKIHRNDFPRFISVDKCQNVESKTRNKIQVISFGSDCLDHYIDACCKDTMAVPNLVNYVWYGSRKNFNFYGFLSFISVIRFVRPCAILVHGDTLPKGPYWDFILNIYPNIIHVKRSTESKMIYGKKIYYKNHFSDLFRIEALLKYGGIYLDMDMVLMKEIDFLRRYPCTMSRMRTKIIASSFIMSEKNSTFLNKWLDGYKYHYQNSSYVYSAMIYPSQLATNYTELIHIEYETLSRPFMQRGDLIYLRNFNWSHIYGMHLYSRIYPHVVNEDIIKHLNSTFGAIARHILFGNKELCRKKS